MRFDAEQLKRIASALIDMADTADRVNVRISSDYGPAYLDVDSEMVEVRYDSDRERFVMDTRQ